MKKITILTMLAAVLLGCAAQREEEGMKVMLEHKALQGNHCESSAILNALNYQGMEISEEQIIGAGAAPGFIYEKGKFPFLGGRTYSLRENLAANTGVTFTVRHNPESPEWDEIGELLEKNIPVIMKVDMRFLPYRYGGKYGPRYMSFGWHPITLFGLDRQKGIAYVSDTEFPDLQEIRIKDLEKARFSKTKVYPPGGEYYWFDDTSSAETASWSDLVLISLKQYSEEMNGNLSNESALLGLDGLKELPEEIRNLVDSVGSWMVSPVLEFHYGCIETNGTGGAAFRTMYHNYLKDYLDPHAHGELLGAADKSETAWHKLAEEYRTASGLYKKASSNEKREILEKVAQAAEALYAAESEFIDVINREIQL